MKKRSQLPEFSVSLARVRPDDAARRTEMPLGQRTKFGGVADWIHYDATPKCCRVNMAFVAQIDSIEHVSRDNPFGADGGVIGSRNIGGDGCLWT
jgi:hypothetical protein